MKSVPTCGISAADYEQREKVIDLGTALRQVTRQRPSLRASLGTCQFLLKENQHHSGPQPKTVPGKLVFEGGSQLSTRGSSPMALPRPSVGVDPPSKTRRDVPIASAPSWIPCAVPARELPCHNRHALGRRAPSCRSLCPSPLAFDELGSLMERNAQAPPFVRASEQSG